MKKPVSLNPGESKVVTFTFIPTSAKTYTVGVDGLAGSFTVIPIPEAEFEVRNLGILYPELYVGTQQIITVDVVNVGDSVGSYEVVCEVI